MQKLLGKLRQAIKDFKLIEDGDRIAVGLSGGKDSLTVLHLLKIYQGFAPERFGLAAITLDLGTGADLAPLKSHCSSLDVPFHLIKTDIKQIVFDIRKEKNPCSLCANLRRGALNNAAKDLGYGKVALGHHKDDAIETLLMSMFYEGRISCFSPMTQLERSGITVIRPMVYIDEREIKRTAKRYQYPIIANPCPANGYSKRQYIKDMLYSLEKEIPGLKNHLL